MTTMTLNPRIPNAAAANGSLPDEQSQSAIIHRAMEFNMEDVVARYMKDEGLTEEIALEHEREIKRFLSMCALNPKACYGMKGPIDEIWHTFIMFTRDYAEFCQQVAGRFIHHIPETGKGENKSSQNYVLFLNDYEVIFGHPAPEQYWPRPALGGKPETSQCSGCGGCSVGERKPSPKVITTEASCGECNGCAAV